MRSHIVRILFAYVVNGRRMGEGNPPPQKQTAAPPLLLLLPRPRRHSPRACARMQQLQLQFEFVIEFVIEIEMVKSP